MPLVDPNRFNKAVSKEHRQLKQVKAFRLNAGALADFQSSFPGITGLKEIHNKLKSLKADGNLWYTTRLAQGKISDLDKDASDLGTGTNLEDVEASGYQEGRKTARMISRTTGPQQIG